jgi:opacity protein-like surface antigen
MSSVMQNLKWISLVLILALIAPFSYSQDNEVVITTLPPAEKSSRSLSFGLQASLNTSWLTSDNKGYVNDGLRVGTNYGLVTDFSLADNKNYYFSTGFIFINLPGRMTSPGAFFVDSISPITGRFVEPSSEQLTYKVRYIQIPLSLKMKTAEIGYIKYFGQFGFTPGFQIRARKLGTITYDSGTEELEEQDASDNITDIRLGIDIGAGLEYNLTGNTNLVVSLIYNAGFTNVLAGDGGRGKAFELDEQGKTNIDPSLVSDNGVLLEGPRLISRSNYVALNVAIFF